MSPQSTISLVIPVYNGQSALAQCLDSVMTLDYPKEDLEIIVVDNNSTDRTKEIIKRYPVKYVFESQRGRARARNAGIKVAIGKYVAFTDCDCIVDKNWLKEIIGGFDSEDVVACGGKILAKETKNWIQTYIEETNMLAQEGTHNDNVERNIYRIVTANAIFNRDIFDKLGYFDEELMTGEDTEMGYRISLYGYQIKYMPQAVVYHKHIKSLKKFCLWHFNFGRADYIYYRKYQKIFDFSPRYECLARLIIVLFLLYKRCLDKLMHKKYKFNFIFLETVRHACFSFGEMWSCLHDIFIDRFKSSPEEIKLLSGFDKKDIFINYNSNSWRINKAIFGTPEGGSVMLYHSVKDSYFMLEGIAALIWRFFLREKEITEIISELSRRYKVTGKEVEHDLIDFLTQLEKEDIVFKYVGP